ncbi:MAG TPA: patatin-like phospholipase family protein [Stellaceae bacterium]|nr:patatin-like phospholipase family protein [Stellaceae bacterium]
MTFRILSLDGGGTWSLIQILTLIDLYRSGGALLSGHHVLRDFDLVAANSGGSLVLGGLLKDLPLGDVAKYFDDPATRRAVFAPGAGARGAKARLRRAAAGVGPRHAAARKLAALRQLLNSEAGEPGLGDITLDALTARARLPTQIMITAFDYDRRSEVIFRSNLQSRAAGFGTPAIATLAEAIHASTTAPVDYFDGPATVSRGRRCWDGALAGDHNPVLAAIAEALANGVPREAIEVLSIGSGSVVLPPASGSEDAAAAKLVQVRQAHDPAGDLRTLAEVLIDDPPDRASFLAHLALGQAVPEEPGRAVGDGTLVRLNPLVQPIRAAGGWVRPAGLIEAEDASDEFLRLRNAAADTVADGDIALIRKFCLLWHNDAVPNQPIRANADTLECEIGQRWYSEAKGRWAALVEARPRAAAAPSPAAPAGQAPPPASGPRSAPPPRLTSPKLN